jgi:hypothetical protein
MSNKTADAKLRPNVPRQRAPERAKEEEKFDAKKEAFKLAREGTPFHDSYGVSYIRFDRKSEGGVTYPIESREFSKEFRRWFYGEHGKLLTIEIFEVLRAHLLAQAGSKRDEVCVRVAALGDAVYIDLCNAEREVLQCRRTD